MMYKKISIILAAALLFITVAFLFLFVEYKKVVANNNPPTSGVYNPVSFDMDILIREYQESYFEPITNYDSEEFVRIGNDDSGMTVKQKKYIYENNDVMILYVENHSGENCSVTLNGSFLNGDGKELTSMEKSFRGLSVGDSNYFVFKPNITFDSFNYTLEVKPYSGTAYSEYIYTGKIDISARQGLTDRNGVVISSPYYWSIDAVYGFLNTYTEKLAISGDWVLFDSYGNIYKIYESPIYYSVPSSYLSQDINWRLETLIYTDDIWQPETEYELPEELSGNITSVVALRNIEKP